jgi:Lrp/AsnC family transcriptional regulator for asnA, asnC and gidA
MKSSADPVNDRILNTLIQNSRLSYRAIARKTGVSVATAINRARSLEREGIIKKNTIQVDYEKLGYDIDVAVFMRVSGGRLLEVEKRISLYRNVYAVYDITGAFDALVLARFRSRRELDGFIKRIQTLEHVERTETNLILNKVKDGL